MPKETSWGLNSGINLQNTLNIEDQAQTIRPFETPAPALLNNGIWHDGGITEIYEQSTTKTGYDVVYAASNGKLLKLKYLAATQYAEIWSEDNGISTYIGRTTGVYFNKKLLNKQYLDIALCSDGTHALGLRAINTGLYVDEILLSDFSITSTITIETVSTNDLLIAGGAICRANVLTAATVKATSGVCIVYTGGGGIVQYILNTTIYDIHSTNIPNIRSQCGYMTAFYNAGTVVVACPAAIPIIRYGVAPYAPANWTTIVEPAGVNGILLAQKNQLKSTTTTLELVASTSSKSYPGFLIQVSAAGAVATGAGPVDGIYPTAATMAAFEMQSGTATPYGAAGVCITTAAGKYGQFIGLQYRKNNPEATMPIQIPSAFHSTCGLMTATGGQNVQIALCGFANNIAFLTCYVGTPPGALLNDFGGGTFDSDMLTGHTFNSLSTGGLLWPFENRAEAGIIPTFVYKRNDGLFVFCQFTYNTGEQFTEISPGVVSINSCTSYNTIIDLNENKAYENMSGYTNAFFGNFTGLAASKAYVKKLNKYSSSFDAGLLYIDPLATSMQGINQFYFTGFSIWSGAAGAYVSNVWLDASGTYTGIAYRSPETYGTTYVFTGTVPPAGDSIFQSPGIKMLSSSAIQYPNYFGYLLVNQFAKSYEAFFLLQGNFYSYDGDKIYLIQLTAGNFGTVVGGPQIMAIATGLTYLCSSPDLAYFLNDFDNGIWTYNGGRTLEKLGHFDQFTAILDAAFNVHDGALLLKTAGYLLSLREGIVTANASPHTVPYTIYSTSEGAKFVKSNLVKQWSHLPLAGSVILPLDYQSAYFGLAGMQRYKVSRVVGTIFCENAKTSPFTITWNWITQDTQGSQVQTFNTSLRNAAGYMRFEAQVYPDAVLGGSIRLTKGTTWTFTGTATIGSPIITLITPITTGLDILVGGAITDSGGKFAAGTVVNSIDSATQITVSNNASATQAGDVFTAAATSQRIVFMDLAVYYTEEAEANLVTKAG